MSKKTKILITTFLLIGLLTTGLVLTNSTSALQQGLIFKFIPKTSTPKIIKNQIDPRLLNTLWKTINPYQAILDSYPSLQKTRTNLQNMTIEDKNSKKITEYEIVLKILENYDGSQKNDIKEKNIENTLSNYNFTKISDKAILINIAHSLWLENKKTLPWSLKDFSEEEIESLFFYTDDPVDYSTTGAQEPNTSLDKNLYGAEIINLKGYDEGIIKLFLLSKTLLKTNETLTIEEIVKWNMKNFFHAYYDYGWEVYGCAGGSFWAEDCVYTLESTFEQRVTGCHEPALIVELMLRSINIPAVTLSILGHGVVYLPTIDRYIHGDNVADFVTVPAKDLLLTKEEIENIIKLGPNGDYDSIIRAKHPSPYHFYTNIELHRKDSSLFLETDSVCTSIPEEDWKNIKNQVPEYNIQYDQANCKIFSDLVPIKTLTELSL